MSITGKSQSTGEAQGEGGAYLYKGLHSLSFSFSHGGGVGYPLCSGAWDGQGRIVCVFFDTRSMGRVGYWQAWVG
jgi:hypothetical protein